MPGRLEIADPNDAFGSRNYKQTSSMLKATAQQSLNINERSQHGSAQIPDAAASVHSPRNSQPASIHKSATGAEAKAQSEAGGS